MLHGIASAVINQFDTSNLVQVGTSTQMRHTIQVVSAHV